MSIKFLKENGFPVDLVMESKEIIPSDNNSWNEIEITILSEEKEIDKIFCKKNNFSECRREYSKGFFKGYSLKIQKLESEKKELLEAFEELLNEAIYLYNYYPNNFRSTSDEYFKSESELLNKHKK